MTSARTRLRCVVAALALLTGAFSAVRGDGTAPVPAPQPAQAKALEGAPARAPAPVPTPATLPAEVDLRPTLLAWGLPPRAQGKRPTCSVFTVVAAMEAALARASGKGVTLSVEYANWAGNDATRRIDDGSFFQDVWDGYAAHGICAERWWRYGRKFDADAKPSPEARMAADWVKVTHPLRLHWIAPLPKKPGITRAHLDEARRVLAMGLPVCAGSYHSVLFVGYVDDPREAGGGVLLVRDSGAGHDDVRITYEAALARFGDVLWIEAVAGF